MPHVCPTQGDNGTEIWANISNTRSVELGQKFAARIVKIRRDQKEILGATFYAKFFLTTLSDYVPEEMLVPKKVWVQKSKDFVLRTNVEWTYVSGKLLPKA